ncbi:MAG: HAMP domain-containing protein, partial [Candidatus Aminicenantes bacterium]|nr:HAMP domain-containing protein [Candidatus Aminicenantes bacterium]
MRASRDPFDTVNLPGGFGPRRLRTKMLLLFGALMAAYVAASHVFREGLTAKLVPSLLFVAFGLAAVIALSRGLTRPIVQLTRTAERLAGGDLAQRARVSGRDEVGTLARTFNGMLDGLEKSFRDLEDRNRFLEDEAAKRAVQMDKDAAERGRIERELRLARIEIDQLVDKRTEELARANDELHGKVLETRRSEDYLQSTLDRLERALEGTFRALSMTLELRDPYMAGHQQRVSRLAAAIAKEMNLPWEKIEGIRFAGIIHDIGKIAAPVEIMAKPGRLSPTE